MLPFKLVWSPQYDLNLGAHVFPSQKYRMIHDRLLKDHIAGPVDFVEPEPASDEDVLLVHTPAWVHALKHGSLTIEQLMKLEIPYSPQTMEAFWLMAGGTVVAARNALRDRLGFSIGGGFHHAFAAHGEGFCAIHDVAIAIRRLQAEGLIQRAMVVDCDVHQGNGTAGIFAGDRSVFTLSIHQFNNYPDEKPPSNIDIHLEDGVGDEDYLKRLREAYDPALRDFRPDLLLYVAGADPFMEDQLGGLLLTLDGLARRDRLVIMTAIANGVPVCVTLAGGYSFNVQDTVTVHVNTIKAAAEILAMARNLSTEPRP
jgi:acetoin utilization deacetylase AcuC-like enzyme